MKEIPAKAAIYTIITTPMAMAMAMAMADGIMFTVVMVPHKRAVSAPASLGVSPAPSIVDVVDVVDVVDIVDTEPCSLEETGAG